MSYITEQDVEDVLGAGWEGSGDPALAVQQANDWLTSKGIPLPDDTDDPDRIKRAGAYLAKQAASGTLYADTRGDIKRKRVKAGTVESETEYQDYTRAKSGDMAYVEDLLKPWLAPLGSVTLLRRL